MKTNLLQSKLIQASLVATGLLFTEAAIGQTTITSGQTITASSITANTAVTIQAGGTLDMDVARSFSNITTANNGTSTIAGTGTVTVNNTITLAGSNTLSIQPVVTAATLATANLNNSTATIDGTGSLSAGTITINAANSQTATLAIGATLTVQGGVISEGAGNGQSEYQLTANGNFKISSTFDNDVVLSCGANSTVEFNGAAQTIPFASYNNLILAGTGTKTLDGDQVVAGNFNIENGTILTLAGNDLNMTANGNRTATINGRLNVNNSGRFSASGTGTKALILGANGYLSLTDNVAAAGFLGLPSFNTYSFNPTSTVEFGSTDDQQIADVAAPGYGNLALSGNGTKSVADALDIQGNLTISSATFNAGNFTHSINGNWVRNGGTFTTGTGRISFTGATAQTIGGSQATTFYAVTFANTNGGIILSQPISIANNATFTSGVVNSDATNLLIFNDEATSSLLTSNATTTSYVSGPVRKIGNNAFVFPIGSTTGFVPLSISAPDNDADAFTVQYFRGVPVDHLNITASGIDHISTCDYWDLAETTDAGAVTTIDATFYWNANNPCNGASSYVTDPTKVKAVHYTGGSWSAASLGFGSGSAISGSVIFAGLATFSPFALGSTTPQDNPLPVIFGDVKAYEKNNGVQIEWSNLTEKDVAEYTIERSANGRDFSAIGTQLPASNQDDKASYTAFDAVPHAGANYYRIKAEETTGKIVYSKILSVNLGKADAGLKLYPNPVSGNQVTISLSNVKNGTYNLRVVNTAGQDIFRQVISNQSNSLTQTLDLPSTIQPGVYNLIVVGDNYRSTKTFIVQ